MSANEMEASVTSMSASEFEAIEAAFEAEIEAVIKQSEIEAVIKQSKIEAMTQSTAQKEQSEIKAIQSTAKGQSTAKKEDMEKVRESHLIVAALIATVTFTAAFTLPGGVIQDGDNEGTAILSKKAAFRAFVITDAIAMVLSLSAVFAHFLMPLHRGKGTSKKITFLAMSGALSTLIAMVAMVIAFVTGTYAVLTTSLGLANLTTFIGLTFFLLMFLIVVGMMNGDQLLKWIEDKFGDKLLGFGNI